jgi:hypothetical protein
LQTGATKFGSRLLISIAETSPKKVDSAWKALHIFRSWWSGTTKSRSQLLIRIAETSPKRVDSTWKKESPYI